MIKRIALTGGPMGGKSKGLRRIKEDKEILKLGWNIITTPESGTIIIPCGFSPMELLSLPDRKKYFKMQELIFNTHLFLENSIESAAKEIISEPLLKVCDRGISDIKCYSTSEEYLRLLHSSDMSEIEARDGRYDAAFHLATIADTDPELYMRIFRENEARYEDTSELAIMADRKTRNAWLGHTHFRIIPNKTLDGKILTFEEKMQLLIRHILHVIAENPLEIEKKFLLYEPIKLDKFPVKYVAIDVEQIYLSEKANKDRIRRRTQDGHSVYYRTRKEETADEGVKKETEIKINKDEYKRLAQFKDPKRRAIHKDRIYFLHENQYFELDIIKKPEQLTDVAFLEIELLDKDEPIVMPYWLGECEDVTGKKEYSMRSLAKR